MSAPTGWAFHTSACQSAARFVCGWDTTKEQIDALAEDIRKVKSLPDARAMVWDYQATPPEWRLFWLGWLAGW